MNKDVSNVEKIEKKQRKQFTIVYIFGLIAFIVMVLVLEGDMFKNKKLNLNDKLLKTPSVLNLDENKERGLELEKIYSSYSVFVEEIDDLELNNLNPNDFEYNDQQFTYVNESYTFNATDNSLKLTRKGKEVYNCSIEDDVTKIKLIKEKEYYLEYSSSMISFKVDSLVYSINIENNQYIVECNYNINEYIIKKEIYDFEWNFINVFIENEIEFTGYFFDNIEGYILSEDKMSIINENNSDETIPSTEFLNDTTTVYYTVINYVFSNGQGKDLLLVNNSQDFPLK